MLIVVERINSTRKAVREAIKSRNSAFIINEAAAQLESGANFIDVNCAMTSGDEVSDIGWVISVIQSRFGNANICIDSPNYVAIDRALKAYSGKGVLMINSITDEDSRIDAILPLAINYKTRLVALTMSESGMPDTAEKRFEIARHIYEKLDKKSFDMENLYFDPLIRPIATEPEQAKEFLKSIPMIKSLGKVKTICGLSNISYGLPNRKVVNSTFFSMAVAAGLDAAIVDPLDKHVMSAVSASRALVCDDEYCADYIKAFRGGKLV